MLGFTVGIGLCFAEFEQIYNCNIRFGHDVLSSFAQAKVRQRISLAGHIEFAGIAVDFRNCRREAAADHRGN
jgi:hypothetical protein